MRVQVTKTILLVDDDSGALKSLQLLLKYAKEIDATIIAVSSIGDALAKLSKKNIDLVITDVNLGSEYGPDIKKAYPKVPFIYTTGDTTWNSSDGTPVSHKPFRHNKFYKLINQMLGESMNITATVKSIVAGKPVTDAVTQLLEVSPPGFSGTSKAMKNRHSDKISNPWALSWWMYKKGYKSHKKPESDAKGIKGYIPPEEYKKRKEKGGKVTKFLTRKKKRLAASLEN